MEQNLVVRAALIKRFYAACFQELLREYNLTQMEADILLFLRNNPEYNTARDIVELRGFAKSNVSTTLEALRLRQFLTIRPDETSRRVRRLFLREEKREVVEALAQRQALCFARMTENISSEELTQVQRLMERMEENIHRYGI